MAVFIYSPGVQVIIQTRKNGLIDVTDDLANGSLTLRENAPHSFQFSLTNMMRKYDGMFTPNDRVVCYMKRIKWLLCFTGYLNSVPFFTAYPRNVSLDATCTLKRLQYHYWDPGTQTSYNLLHSGPAGSGADKELEVDGGLKDKTVALLTQVAGWDPDKIHIGAIPSTWMKKIASIYESILPQIQADIATLGAAPSVGSNPLTDGKAQIATEAWNQLPSSFGTVTNSDPSIQGTFALTGETPSNSDPWYCSMHLPYLKSDGSHYLLPADEASAKTFWTNQKILVVNPTNNKAVVLRVVGWGPDPVSGRTIAISPQALTTLGANVDDDLHIAFAPNASTGVGSYGDPPVTSAAHTNNGPAPSTSSTPAAPGPSAPPPVSGTTPPLAGAAAAITFAQAQLGKTYIFGAGRPFFPPSTKDHYDCSGLTGNAWAAAGILLGSTSQAQYQNDVNMVPGLDQSQWLPGDLVFYFPDGNGLPDHVALYIGNGKQIVARSSGEPIVVQDVFTQGLVGAGRVKGQPATAADLAAAVKAGGTAAAASGGTNGPGSPASSSTDNNSGGPNLINAWDWQGGGPSGFSDELTGARALMNDEPILPTIDVLLQSSMRSYCAAPNGDFIAWFPDYFGVYQTAATIIIENVELQDFTITWSDDHLITHQYVAGSGTGGGFQQGGSNTQPGGPVEQYNMLQTQGICSIDFPEILSALFNVDGASSPFGSYQDILNRYGARPDFKSMGTLSGDSEGEFWYALALFQRNWAQQFTANVPLTFMPELWPGMLIQLPEYQFQAYVNQVVHNFNFSQGGGFTTNAYVSAPSTNAGSGSKLWGLNTAGVGT